MNPLCPREGRRREKDARGETTVSYGFGTTFESGCEDTLVRKKGKRKKEWVASLPPKSERREKRERQKKEKKRERETRYEYFRFLGPCY